MGYSGHAYAGWAAQPGQVSVQSVLEGALAEALGHPARGTAASRTDAGVHADAQVVSFETSSSIPPRGLVRALVNSLPADIWPIDAEEVAAEFDARRSARRRWYRYVLWRGAAPSSLWRGRCLPVPDALDLSAMRRAAGALLGRHDFAALAAEPPSERSTVRTVYAADWLVRGQLASFEICADGFLTHMVRCIVGTLLWVGRGRWSAEQFRSALESLDRRAAGPNAPAIGLTLSRIEY
ncbi:MAG: tRNA pseudouridine(38-40) synthase TruA [Chloroflexota bacterium]|nr:tRNA pseudouridine(38-40) synthase TruA [Chloroflexota bacterium]